MARVTSRNLWPSKQAMRKPIGNIAIAAILAAVWSPVILRAENPSTALNAADFAGADWLSRVNRAAAGLVAGGSAGGSIEVPDSIAGRADTRGVIPSNVSLLFSGSATFSFCEIDIGAFTRIYSHGALLQISGAHCSGIRQDNRAILQTTGKFVLDGVRIDCNGQPDSTGIFVGNNHAQTAIRDVTVANCTTGVHLEGAQFGEFSNLSLYHNYVGMKIYSTPAGGGGNSNSFYGLKAVGNTVGVLIADNAAFGMGPNYFINPSLLSNSVAGMAVFGRSGPSEVHWYGGAPEVNGGGAENVSVDGRVIKQATVYANLARITLSEVEIEEARISPVIRAEHSSEVTLNNVSGYGRWDGTLVSADSSSATTLEGRLDVLGTIENVVAYPQVLAGPACVRLSGSPLVSLNPAIPNRFPGDAMTPHPVDIRGSISTRALRDPQLGLVTVVRHANRRGSQEANRVNFGAVAAPSSGQSILVSILLKASCDCSYAFGFYADAYSTMHVALQAEEWTRVVIYKAKPAAAEKSFTLVGWPEDGGAPEMSFSALEVLISPANSLAGRGYMGSVLSGGAVNPNHPPGRETGRSP